MKVIPIPDLGSEKATFPIAMKFTPACEIFSLTFVPVGNGVTVSTKHPRRFRFSICAARCFSDCRSVRWMPARKE